MRNNLSFIFPLVLFAVSVLSACAGTNNATEPPAYTVIQPGMSLSLNEALTITPQKARVYFQNGQIVNKLEVDQYRPSCNILSFQISDDNQTVEPDKFKILRVRIYSQLVQHQFPQFASINIMTVGGVMGWGPMAEIFTTLLDIESAKNPDIQRLECLAWRKPHTFENLSMADIRQALGHILVFNS